MRRVADKTNDVFELRNQYRDLPASPLIPRSRYSFPASTTKGGDPAKGVPRCLDINDDR